MSVVFEFTIDIDKFQLGDAFSVSQTRPSNTNGSFRRELVYPFICLTTDADLNTVLDEFETNLFDQPSITEVQAIDKIENGALY